MHAPPRAERQRPALHHPPRALGPNSRTTQLFINYVDNARLDGMGFAPFGEVEGDGMEVVKRIYNCGEKPNQGSIQTQGNKYLDASFPSLSKITKVRIIEPLKSEM